MADPTDYANVFLHLNCDGSDGSVTFTDQSPSARAITVFGNAQVDTAQSKFGDASAKFDGSGDYLKAANPSNITGNLTFEFWVRFSSVGTGDYKLLCGMDSWTILLRTADSKITLNYTGAYPSDLIVSSAISTGVWYHIAWVRSGSTNTLYLDGVSQGTYTATNTIFGLDFYFGGSPFGGWMNGHIDEIRCTRSEALYTANFTPPTAAFPTSSAPATVEGRISASGPLGQPAALGLSNRQGLASAAGPLGAAQSLAVHDFSAFVDGLATFYVMDMATPTGTVRAPISSWQATLQTGSANYLQCVIPACEPYLVAINAATAFTVSRRAVLLDGSVMEYPMASAPVGNTSISRGTAKYTAVLDGYGAALTADNDPPAALDRTLQDVRAVFTQASGLRVRCGVDWLLRPAQRALLGSTPFVVSYINYYVTDGDQYMDVGERIEVV